MATETVPTPSLRPIRSCNACGQATTEYTEHDVFGVILVSCAGCESADPAEPTISDRRAEARRKIVQARGLARDAAVLLDDGVSLTAHRNSTTAMVALDDVFDAINSHEEIDRQVAQERLRQWADDHGENGAELAAEARGEI